MKTQSLIAPSRARVRGDFLWRPRASRAPGRPRGSHPQHNRNENFIDMCFHNAAHILDMFALKFDFQLVSRLRPPYPDVID
jgi:hypothetical protein